MTTNTTSSHSLFSGKRAYAVAFMFAYVVISYIDRVNISIAGPAIAREFQWDSAQMGWIFAAYAWAMMPFYIPMGALLDKFGVRRVCAIAISIWSAAAMLTGAATGFVSMYLARLLLGVGESATFPGSNKVIRQWIPANERGLATTLYHSGHFFGIGLFTPVVAWIVLNGGWRTSFVVFGALGFVWVTVWLRWFHPPEECPWLPADERTHILQSRDGVARSSTPSGPPTAPTRSALGTLVRQRTMWGLFFSQGCANYTNYLFLAWLPSYLVQARGMTLMRAGIFTAIPYLVAGICEVFLGKLSDRLLTPEQIRQGGRRRHVAAFMLASMVVLPVGLLENEMAILGVVTLVLICNTTVLGFMHAVTSDLVEDPRMVATAFGITMTGGNTFGLIAPIVTGYIVKSTGSFNSAFALAACFALAGAIFVMTMTRQPLRPSTPTGGGHSPLGAGVRSPEAAS